MKARFTHWLVHGVGYEAVLLSDRRELHRTVADALEETAHAPASPPSDGELRTAILRQRPEAARAALVARDVAVHRYRGGAPRRAGLLFALAGQADAIFSRFREADAICRSAAEKLRESGDTIDVGLADSIRAYTAEHLAGFDESRELCERILATVHGETHPDARVLTARAEAGLGFALFRLGRLADAVQHLEAAADVAREAGAEDEELLALNHLGALRESRGELDAAESLYRECLGRATSGGNRLRSMSSINGLGVVLWSRGDFAGAAAQFESGLAISRSIGSRYGEAWSLMNRATALTNRGDRAAALADFERAAPLAAASGDLRGEWVALAGVAAILHGRGLLAESESLYRRVLEARRSFRDAQGWIETQLALGMVLTDRDAHAEAEAMLVETESAARAAGTRDLLSWTLCGLSRLRLRRGTAGEAVRDAEEALSIALSIGSPLTRSGATSALACARRDPVLAAQAVAGARLIDDADHLCDALLAAAEVSAAPERAAALAELDALILSTGLDLYRLRASAIRERSGSAG